MSEFVKDYWGAIIALVTVLGTIFYNGRKVQVDESALVLGKWKELVEAHQSQINALSTDLKTVREQMAANERAFNAYREAAEARQAKLEARIRDLEQENAGLKRTIAQNSVSTVLAIGRSRRRSNADRAQADVDRAQSLTDRADIQDLTERLDKAGHNSEGRDDFDDEGS